MLHSETLARGSTGAGRYHSGATTPLPMQKLRGSYERADGNRHGLISAPNRALAKAAPPIRVGFGPRAVVVCPLKTSTSAIGAPSLQDSHPRRRDLGLDRCLPRSCPTSAR